MRRHARAWIVAVVAAVALTPVGIAVGLGGSGSVGSSRASCLDLVELGRSVSTSSRTWTDVPGMRIRNVLARNLVVQMSGTFNGSDVQFRVRDTSLGGTSSLLPVSTTFRVGAVPTGFSFSWVGSNPAQHQHTFRLQWRVPSGGTTQMMNGNLTLLYQGAPTPESC